MLRGPKILFESQLDLVQGVESRRRVRTDFKARVELLLASFAKLVLLFQVLVEAVYVLNLARCAIGQHFQILFKKQVHLDSRLFKVKMVFFKWHWFILSRRSSS